MSVSMANGLYSCWPAWCNTLDLTGMVRGSYNHEFDNFSARIGVRGVRKSLASAKRYRLLDDARNKLHEAVQSWNDFVVSEKDPIYESEGKSSQGHLT